MKKNTKKIVFCKRSEINVAKWDLLVRNSPQRLIYFESWYIDSMTNGNWNALIYGDYEFVMPLPFKKKYFINYVYQPFITQRLGVIGLNRCTSGLLSQFLDSIPYKYLIVEQNIDFQTDNMGNYNTVRRFNHVLDLKKSYETIVSGYNRNTKRNIETAKGFELEIIYDLDIEQFAEFQCNWEPYEFTKPNKANVKNMIVNAGKYAKPMIVGVADNVGLVSVGLFIVNIERVYFLLCASSEVGKKKRAMFYLIDRMINKYAGQDKLFDFTGSSIKSIAQRNLGFGADIEYYSFINRKSLFQSLLKKVSLLR